MWLLPKRRSSILYAQLVWLFSSPIEDWANVCCLPEGPLSSFLSPGAPKVRPPPASGEHGKAVKALIWSLKTFHAEIVLSTKLTEWGLSVHCSQFCLHPGLLWWHFPQRRIMSALKKIRIHYSWFTVENVCSIYLIFETLGPLLRLKQSQHAHNGKWDEET